LSKVAALHAIYDAVRLLTRHPLQERLLKTCFQQCFDLTKEKMYKSLQQAEILRKQVSLEAQLREQAQGLAALEVSRHFNRGL
jgi:hypothetical protein